jgi:phosphotransferase system enzyme I (PtsP)
MLRASAGRELRLMFPMIAHVGELDAAKALLERELAHLKRHSHPLPSALKLGIMVEVPSLLWELEEICARVDFLSVGSNDLVQYLYAADRDNARVSLRYDTLSPSILRALKAIVDKAKATRTPVTLCGEMGGKPLDALALMAIGYRGLSMSPAAIGPVKAMVLATDLRAARTFVAGLINTGEGSRSIRKELRGFAAAHGIPV